MHYGSANALAENNTSLNSYFLQLDAKPFENIALTLKAGLTDAHQGFDPVTEWDIPTNPLAHHDFEGYSEINEYSDLDYNIYELGLNLTYLISDDLSLVAEATYNKFQDYQPYVYGDTTGNWFYGKLGVRYIF